MTAPLPRIEAHLSLDLSKLSGVSSRAEDLTPVWLDDVQPYVTDFLMRRFQSEGAYQGTAWAALAPATRALRAQPGRGRGGIGRDTNRMWASLVKSAGSSPAPGGLLHIGPDRYERGSALPYARYFAGGYNSKTKPVRITKEDGSQGWTFVRRKTPKRIPARPIFPDPLPDEFVAHVSEAVRRYIVGGAGGGQ